MGKLLGSGKQGAILRQPLFRMTARRDVSVDANPRVRPTELVPLRDNDDVGNAIAAILTAERQLAGPMTISPKRSLDRFLERAAQVGMVQHHDLLPEQLALRVAEESFGAWIDVGDVTFEIHHQYAIPDRRKHERVPPQCFFGDPRERRVGRRHGVGWFSQRRKRRGMRGSDRYADRDRLKTFAAW